MVPTYTYICTCYSRVLRISICALHNNNGLLSYVLMVGIFYFFIRPHLYSFVRRTKFTVNDSIIISDVLLHCESVYTSSSDLRPGTIV